MASIHNTILKMAKKRSVVDASLTLSNASEYFTQDIEDMAVVEEEEPESENPSKITEKQIDELKALAKEVGFKKLELGIYRREPKVYYEVIQVLQKQKEQIAEIKILHNERVVEDGFLKEYLISDWDSLHRLAPKRLGEMIEDFKKLPLANEPEKVELPKRTKAEKIQAIKDKIKELGYKENSPEVTKMLTPYGAFNVSQLVSLDGKTLDKILKEEFAEE